MPTDRSHPAECFEGCFATSARLIDRVIQSAYDDALRPLDIRATQVTLLAAIGTAHQPLARDLVPILRIDQTTLSRTIDRLVERGLVEKLESDDARHAPLALTRPGRALLAKALPIWKRGQSAIAELLGQRFSRDLVAAADRLRRHPPTS